MKLHKDAELALRRGWAFVQQGAALVAIDPGASTGWAVRTPGGLHHGQDRPAAAAAAVRLVLGTTPIGLLAVEEPFLIGQGNQWKLAWAGGEVFGRLAGRLVDERCVWFPKPVSWRSVLGLQSGRKAARDRESVNVRVHTLAEARCRHPLRTSSGAPEYDRASAVCLLFAADGLCASLW